MNRNLRIGNTLLVTLLACGLVACTSQGSNTAGTGGSAAGGATPAGTGGSGATAGTTASGDGSGTLCPPPQQIITDFTWTPSDAGTTSTAEVRFGSAGTLQGGESYYPGAGKAFPLTVDVTHNNFHVTGTIGDYSGFGLYLDNCDHLDVSAYRGISFTISGSVQGNAITFGMGTIDDTPTWTWLSQNGKTEAKTTDAGRCTPSSNTTNQYYHPGCGDPTVQIPVSATPTPQTVLWGSLTGGTPASSINPKEVTSIYWIIPWSSGTYAVDLTLDDLQLVP